MKELKAIAFCMLLSIACIRLSAQTKIPLNEPDFKVPLNEPDYNKPKIFSDLPQQMTLQAAEADLLFSHKAGDVVKAQLTSQFLVSGTVVSNGGSHTAKTIILKIPARNNAILTLTRTSTPDGIVTYAGRLMSRSNGDAYEIKSMNGQSILNKINLYDLISE